uniref:Uncharacterized protein n=1 Tax=Moniliophthora roreri TaxID=221103 RepID=A0A0W0FB34_MONRR
MGAESTFEKLNTSSTTSSLTPVADFKFDFGERKTFPVGPSELLSRVQAFLPQIEASNAELAQRMEMDPKSVDIEHIAEGTERYIEMNLGLGVFTAKTKSSEEDAEMSPSSDSSDSTSSNSVESDSDSEYDSDSDDESGIISSSLPPHLSAVNPRMMMPLPRRSLSDRSQKARPQIVVLNSTPSSPDVNMATDASAPGSVSL